MIVDQFGNPINRKLLEQEQTSGLMNLRAHIQGHPARGITPARLNQILDSAEQGDLIAQHELFRDIEERDAHVFSELSKRKRAVVKLDWDIAPPRNPSKQEQDAASYVKELLLDMTNLEDLIFDCLDGIAHGFSALEIEWIRYGSEWHISKTHHRPQSWFQTDLQTRTQIRLRDATPEGAALQPFGWVFHTHKAASGYPSRSGLGRVLVWPFIFKCFAVGDLAEFLDIYGMPIRIGKYPANSDEKTKATLWRAVAEIGHNAAGIIPDSMKVELTEAAKGGEKPFEAMIGWCERSESKAILGSTLTSDASPTGLGSNTAVIHNEVRLDIRDSDCKQLSATLTRDVIYPLLALNKGWADLRRCPRFIFDTAQGEDLKLFADALPKLVDTGMRIPVQWAHERLRIPLAGDDEDLLVAKEQGSKASEGKTVRVLPNAKNLAMQSAKFKDQEALDAALADVSAGLQPLAKQWLTPALEALEKAGSADAALELLSSEHPLVDDEVLTEAVARVLFVSELIGENSASQELS